MALLIKHFEELEPGVLYTLLQFRQEVFIVEQVCPYLDADGKDVHAWHIWLTDIEGGMTAYCRVLPEGLSYPDYISIGRVISRREHRGKGLGRDLMLASLAWIKEKWPGKPIKISAQCYLEHFYTSFGFVGIGETYLEDDIPHRAMIKSDH